MGHKRAQQQHFHNSHMVECYKYKITAASHRDEWVNPSCASPYNKNAHVCAKWQWNAWDCVTGLHDSPGVQSSNNSRVRFTVISHTPGRSHFYHIHIMSKRNWDGACLMNWTQQSYSFFKFAFCSIVLLNLGETCHLKGRVMVTLWRTLLLLRDTIVQHYDVTRFEYVLWRNTMHKWVTNIHYQTWIALGRFINISRTPSKQ